MTFWWFGLEFHPICTLICLEAAVLALGLVVLLSLAAMPETH